MEGSIQLLFGGVLERLLHFYDDFISIPSPIPIAYLPTSSRDCIRSIPRPSCLQQTVGRIKEGKQMKRELKTIAAVDKSQQSDVHTTNFRASKSIFVFFSPSPSFDDPSEVLLLPIRTSS